MKKILSMNQSLNTSQTIVWGGKYDYATKTGLEVLKRYKKIINTNRKLLIFGKLNKTIEQILINEIFDIYNSTLKINGKIYGGISFTKDLNDSQNRVAEIMRRLSYKKRYIDKER